MKIDNDVFFLTPGVLRREALNAVLYSSSRSFVFLIHSPSASHSDLVVALKHLWTSLIALFKNTIKTSK
jgi:hypothetical protein